MPLALFVLVGAFLAIGLTRDPSTLPSALVGKPAPEFTLPPLEGRDGHGLEPRGPGRQADAGQRVRLLVRALPHRASVAAAAGRAGRDRPGHQLQGPAGGRRSAWLAELGDPYPAHRRDRDGRVGIDWGVYGVPETYVIDKEGRIAYRHVGPLQPQDLDQTILPLLES